MLVRNTQERLVQPTRNYAQKQATEIVRYVKSSVGSAILS